MSEYLSQLNPITAQAAESLKQLKKLIPGNLRNIELVGCGATLSQMYVLQYFLEQHSSVPVRLINAGEFAARRPKSVGHDTVVITSSHSGSTKETVAAAKYAKEMGAVSICITANGESNLAANADYSLLYPPKGKAPSESKVLLLLLVGFAVLAKEGKDIQALWQDFLRLPEALATVSQEAEERADQFAEAFHQKNNFYILGAGPAYGVAYAFSICKFMEMQWLHACALDAGEFFHGPLERAEAGVPYLLLLTEDKSRPVAERVENFFSKYLPEVGLLTIDTQDYSLPGISKANREFFATVALWPVMNLYMDKFAALTGHDLNIRRYMGKLSY